MRPVLRSRSSAVLFTAASAVLAAAPAFAHHAFAAAYFEDQKAVVRGTLLEFDDRNPHSLVVLEAPDPKTQRPVRWTVEWASTQRLAREGVNPNTLKPGEYVIVLGHPGRIAEDHKLHMWGITRPADGWHWGHAIE